MDQKIFLTFILILASANAVSREKRFLLFPRANPTRIQFVFGVGIPLDLPQISVISGYVLRGNYYLPWDIQQFVPMFLKNETILADEIWTRLNRTDFLRRKREANYIEKSQNEIIPAQKNYEIPFNSRWTFYDIIIGAIENQGYVGKSCLLRAICEAATVKFTHYSGIIGELLHVLLSPSTSNDKILKHEHHEYYFAEDAGLKSKPCHLLFKDCTTSILEFFTNILEVDQ
ncbi:uncharacterized protein LOC134834479 [Culicoides brevitarsis]|uniref:uncharacterized protein LOC134834479 n=1 Tax=Culicoides brevitarsis TaxID=469753 RepID=UPI00307C5248